MPTHEAKRIYKGKGSLSIVSDYTVVDIETTGLDPSCDEIIEIAALKIHDGKCIDEFQSLSSASFNLSPFITELTGITDEMLQTAPPISDVLEKFIGFLGDSIVVGHNVNFDINFIYDYCLEIFGLYFENNYIDTMRIARHVCKGLKNYKLSTLSDALSVTVLPAHRSLSDCYATYECYEKLKQYATVNHFDLDFLQNGYSSVRAKDIKALCDNFDTLHPLYNQICVFTGQLEKMSRYDAMQAVANIGGICNDSVTKRTNFLIVGNFDYCKSVRGNQSTKMKKAEKYKQQGLDIKIISENVFYDLLEE